MKPKSVKQPGVLNWIALLVGVILIASSGCYQRTVAPELTYDQSQVEALDEEIKKLDWE